MYIIVWRFRPRPGCEAEFERTYGPSGAWARLFARAEGYRGTELLRGEQGDYLCIDRWDSRDAWEAFRSAFGREYEELDRASETLTAEETPLGSFSRID
ncbi:MAG TPA: antibiotic biosynthesis monooxygenase [Longimicrobium sp.]|nr:antibiotic biosynthesis monooxygenase [Longimicrobium sp.]